LFVSPSSDNLTKVRCCICKGNVQKQNCHVKKVDYFPSNILIYKSKNEKTNKYSNIICNTCKRDALPLPPPPPSSPPRTPKISSGEELQRRKFFDMGIPRFTDLFIEGHYKLYL
jgi:hypothetical protein